MGLSKGILPLILLAWLTGKDVANAGSSVDLVFMIDESGSMSGDQAEVKAQANFIFQKLQDEVANSPALDSFRVGLVGFGRSGYPNNIYMMQQLTDNKVAFQTQVDALIASGGTEPGLDTIYHTTRNSIPNGGLSVEPGYLPPPQQGVAFPGNEGYCALVITDEESNGDVYTLAQVQTELTDTKSIAFVVGPSFTNSYETLATSTGGGYYTIDSFRSNANPVLQDILTNCVSAIQQNVECTFQDIPYEVESTVPATIQVSAVGSCTVGPPIGTHWASVHGEVTFANPSQLITDATTTNYGIFDITFTTECEDPNDATAPNIVKTCSTTIEVVPPPNTPPRFNCVNPPCPACPTHDDMVVTFNSCHITDEQLEDEIVDSLMFVDDEGHPITYALDETSFELGDTPVSVTVTDVLQASTECPLIVRLVDGEAIDESEVDCGLYKLREGNPDWHIQPCDTPLRFVGSAYGNTNGLKPNGCPVTTIVDPSSLMCERCNGAAKVIHPDCDGVFLENDAVRIEDSSGVGNFISWKVGASSAGQPVLHKACGVCVERPNNDGCRGDRNLRNRELSSRFECPESKPSSTSGGYVWPLDSMEAVDTCEAINTPNQKKGDTGNKGNKGKK